MLADFKVFCKKRLPEPVVNFLRVIRDWKDCVPCASFLLNHYPRVSLRDRARMVKQFYVASFHLDSPHAQREILDFIQTILRLKPNSKGVLVEAGCYQGSSTAKFSLAADIVGKELVVFDSFQGIPEHSEAHSKNIFGGLACFNRGDYSATLEEVKRNVSKYGKIDRCRFIEGWFEHTLPQFKESISAIYLDVDLASSTRTCLKYLYPLLQEGGVLLSQDGHLPLVIDVFNDDDFWVNEVGCRKPEIYGLGRKKLIRIVKKSQESLQEN